VRKDPIEPEGRLLSCELEIYQGSPHGRESRRWKRVWVNPSVTVEQANELEAKYPKPDRSGDVSILMAKLGF
jgi:hypothetical protein